LNPSYFRELVFSFQAWETVKITNTALASTDAAAVGVLFVAYCQGLFWPI